MKQLRLFLAALAVAFVSVAHADTYTYLTVSESGDNNSYELSNIAKITFDDTYMNIALETGSTVLLPLASLTTMEFSNTNGISLPDNRATIEITSDGKLRVNTEAGGRIFLYNIKGQQEKTFSTTAQQTDIDLSSLPRGIYVVRVNSTTKKIVNQ